MRRCKVERGKRGQREKVESIVIIILNIIINMIILIKTNRFAAMPLR